MFELLSDAGWSSSFKPSTALTGSIDGVLFESTAGAGVGLGRKGATETFIDILGVAFQILDAINGVSLDRWSCDILHPFATIDRKSLQDTTKNRFPGRGCRSAVGK